MALNFQIIFTCASPCFPNQNSFRLGFYGLGSDQFGSTIAKTEKKNRNTYLSTMSACPWFNVDLMHESNTRRCSSISRFAFENFAMSFASSASARAALCAFHLSRMVMITAQYFVNEERMASAGSLDFRGAHTASTTSYSAASPASVGRIFGRGDGS